MRNLKRALSLTLASVMLLGMMVIGTSAVAGYSDVDAEDNVEAIEVLQAIEVMVGDDRGFGPDRPVSRAEMAVVMGKLLNLDYNYYVATCPFADVSGNYDWAKGWVGACAANGIVSGRGDGIYDPAATVSAVEAASMMMRALGYFQYESDYADGFVLVTVRQASKIGLFNDVNADTNTPLTRNQVAQLALNTLEADMVDAQDNTLHITTGENAGNVNITGGNVTYVVRTSASKFAQAIDSTSYEGSSSDGRQGSIVQLGEQLYQGNLEKDADVDAFGAPSTVWTYKNNQIGVYADEADATYTKELKLKDIYKDLGLTGEVAANKVSFWIDGVDDSEDETIYANDGTTDLNGVSLVKSGTQGDLKLGGNGVLVKAYKGEDNSGNDVVTICVINTYALQVDGEYDTKREELRLKELDGVTELPGTTSTKLSSEDFAGLSSYDDGDYVLVTVADEEIQTIKAAESFTEAVTAYVAKKGDDNSNSVTAGGATYKYNKNYTAKTYEVKEQYVLVLDNYGYVIFTDGVDIADQYVYVVSARPRGGVKADMEADAYFEDGTNEVIVVTSGSVEDLSWNATSGEDDVHAWFTYEKKSGGKYELTALEGKEAAGGSATQSGAITIADTNTSKVFYADKKSFPANVDTTFIVLRGDAVTIYNGIREIPTIEGKSSGAYVNAVMDGSYAKYVFIEGGKDDLSIKGGVDAHIYIYDEEPTVSVDDDGNKVYTYNVIKDGELATVDMNSKTYASGENWSLGLYGDLTTDGNGYIDSAARIEDAQDDDELNLKAYQVDGGTLEINGDVLTLNAFDMVLARDYTIWVSDGDDTGKLTKNQFNRDYDESFKGVVYVALEDDMVTEIYVEEDEDVFDSITPSKVTNVQKQPESAEEIKDRLESGMNDGLLSSNITGSEGLVDLSVKQFVTEEDGIPVIHLYGTLDASKVFNKDTKDESIKEMLEIWYWGLSEDGEVQGSFDSIAAALKTIYGNEGENYTVSAVVFSYGGYTQIQLVRSKDGVASNGAGNSVIDKDFAGSGTDCKLDISDLKFPS